MDTEFRNMFAYIHDRNFKRECMDLFSRGQESWLNRVAKMRQWAAHNGMILKDMGPFVGVYLYSQSSTRKYPACIYVTGNLGEDHPGERFMEHLGVCQYSIVEKGFVRLDQTSEVPVVRTAAKSEALHQ